MVKQIYNVLEIAGAFFVASRFGVWDPIENQQTDNSEFLVRLYSKHEGRLL